MLSNTLSNILSMITIRESSNHGSFYRTFVRLSDRFKPGNPELHLFFLILFILYLKNREQQIEVKNPFVVENRTIIPNS